MKRKRSKRGQRKRFQGLQRNKVLHYVIAITFLLWLAGCGGGTPASSTPKKGKGPPVEKNTPQVATRVENKEPEKKEETEYSYNPAGKPDPFKPFIQLTSVRESSRNVPLTPLQRYEISQLKLVAVISAPEGNVALVEDGSGKGFFIKKGTAIGKNDGKVTKILQDKVIIEELYQDILGQTKGSEVSLNLYRPEEGEEP